jgi:hypothetical protein
MTIRNRRITAWAICSAVSIAILAADCFAAEPSASPASPIATAAPLPAASMDQEVQKLKDEVLDLNRELFSLEEELLFPSNTQVAVFVSMDVGDFFGLDSVQLTLDGKQVSKYLYTEREAKAMYLGGVHRVFLGNVKTGDHELVAIFTGQGTHERDYRRGATLRFAKGIGAKFVELKISDRASKQQPEFLVREWE